MRSAASLASTMVEHLEQQMAASKEHLTAALSGESLAVQKERWRAVPTALNSADPTARSTAATMVAYLAQQRAACLEPKMAASMDLSLAARWEYHSVWHLVDLMDSMTAVAKAC